MKITLKLISAVLAVFMLCGVVACSTPETPNTDTTSATTTAVQQDETTEAIETEINRDNAVSSIPAELKFEGKTIRFGYQDGTRYRDDIIGTESANLIESSVFKRNMAACEKLGVTIEAIPMGKNNTDAGSGVEKLISAGDDSFDVDSGHQSVMTKLVVKGYFVNLKDINYLDFEKPWWAYDYMKEMGVGENKIYFMLGDINLMMLRSGGCVFFNKNLMKTLGYDVDKFYSDVLNGNWTLEDLYTISDAAYSDTNGNNIADSGDIFGFCATTVKSVDHFQYDANVIATTRDGSGVPQLTINNDRTIECLELLNKLYYENKGALISTEDTAIDKSFRTEFIAGNVLFNPSWFYTAEYLGEMKNDYGIIPYPKFNTEQQEYRTLVHNGTTILTVPSTLSKDRYDLVGAFCEEMAYQSYVSLTPTYFELALKTKYSRDSVSGQILDMLYASFFTNFGYVFSGSLSGLGTLRSCVASKSNDFSSYYKGASKNAIKSLNDLIKAFSGVN